jgi:SHS2 domain-containing protein
MAHRFIEHVGEVEVELEAHDEAGVFEAALEALSDLVQTETKGETASREIELTESDHTMLLAEWLNELAYLAEVEEIVPERLSAFELTGDRLRATVEGHRGRPRHLVKAVTLHKLSLRPEEGAWHGHVVLDV